MTTPPAFLTLGGRAATAIEAFDWTKTPLGPIDQWPQSLKTPLGMMLSSKFPKAIVWGRDLITFHNDAFEPILGEKPAAIGRSFRDVWAEAWPELKPMVDNAFAGVATFIENFPLTINRHGYPEEAFFTFCYSPIRDESGEVAGMMDTVMETTETVLAQRQVAVVNAELAHRMRNVLTMVTAITDMSLRQATSLDEARTLLSQHLAALGRAQSCLLAEAETTSSIVELLDQSLAPHASLRQQIRVSGSDCHLNAKQGLALSLAMNELITNSIKYGALSNGDGTVSIEWDPAGFRFAWAESGSAGKAAETREGFGTRVLTQFVPSTFNGEARVELRDDGFRYEITAPAGAVPKL